MLMELHVMNFAILAHAAVESGVVQRIVAWNTNSAQWIRFGTFALTASQLAPTCTSPVQPLAAVHPAAPAYQAWYSTLSPKHVSSQLTAHAASTAKQSRREPSCNKIVTNAYARVDI
jgi:hypothetical protein